MNTFKVDYVTTLPKEGNAPRINIKGDDIKDYTIEILEINGSDEIIRCSGHCMTNQFFIPKVKQWYTDWEVRIFNEEKTCVYSDTFDVTNKVVFIKMDAFALGDTIAWIPYVEEFRVKRRCTVICSTFHNHLLIEAYPNIMFVNPNTVINNVYAQYYIGAINDSNLLYSPINVNQHPLQKVASSILGLEDKEIKPNLACQFAFTKPRFERYVTLSEFGSHAGKDWKVPNGWQKVVDLLNSKDYKVVVISKEKTELTGIIDKTGDIPLEDRAVDILHADYHLGVSSGLSWLSWALGTHVVLISDVTPKTHEFKSNVTRINASDIKEVNYLCEAQFSIEEVLNKIAESLT